MKKIPLIWTNDDIHAGRADEMEMELAFLASFNLKGTFFVPPFMAAKKRLTDDSRLVELLKKAMSDGHDVQQHSTTHQCIENGTADLRMFDLMGDGAKVQYTEDRFVWERLWELDAITAQIDFGRQIWIDAFGQMSEGYRPGCGSFCGNMYRAAKALGFKWVSAQMTSMTGWMWQADHYDYSFKWDLPALPYEVGGLIEFPILDDVAFRVPEDKINLYADLGWQHWEKCIETGSPFQLLCHPQGLSFQGGTGYAVHKKLLARILETGLAAPMTLTQYYAQIQEGNYPLGKPVNLNPTVDELPAWHALSIMEKSQAKASQ